MSLNDLYYSFSTIAQVLAATTALSGAFAFFRINKVNELLVGTGQVVYDRLGEKGYEFRRGEEKKYKDRLRDALNRKNIGGIREVIKVLRDIEIDKGETVESRPKGVQVTYTLCFEDGESYLKRLRKRTYWTIMISFLAIWVSTLSLSFVGQLDCSNLTIWISAVNQILFIVALIQTFRLIRLTLLRKTNIELIEGKN